MRCRGRVAVVAGATRGAGRAIAVELARSGAFVYATGRSSRVTGPSDMDRPETIEETGELMAAAGGDGVGVPVDHLDVEAVRALVDRVRRDHGRLDVLVNDIFGGDRYAQWDRPLWEHDLTGGLRMLRMGIETHIVTSVIALPLMLETGPGLLVEMTDGTTAVNADVRAGVGFYYDFVKASVDRLVKNLPAELADHPVTPVGVMPGWLRSDRMLEQFGVTKPTWRDACRKVPGFEGPVRGPGPHCSPTRGRLRDHGHRRVTPPTVGASPRTTGGGTTSPWSSASTADSDQTA